MAGIVLNPKDAVGSTSTKPDFPANSETLRKWFRNCTTPESDDGTQRFAEDANTMLYFFRHSMDEFSVPDNPPRESLLTELLQKVSGDSNAYLSLPIYPEITEAGNVLAISSATGQVTVDAAQGWLHRGWKIYSASDYALAARQFTTAASQTYHLRWSLANGFALKNLADTGYNPAVLPEADATFDTKYDDMLMAKIITDGSNVPTVTTLANAASLAAELYGAARSYSGANEADHIYDFYFAWARRPEFYLKELYPPSNARDSDYTLYSLVRTREHLRMYSWTWHHSGTTSYPSQSLGFRLNLEA